VSFVDAPFHEPMRHHAAGAWALVGPEFLDADRDRLSAAGLRYLTIGADRAFGQFADPRFCHPPEVDDIRAVGDRVGARSPLPSTGEGRWWLLRDWYITTGDGPTVRPRAEHVMLHWPAHAETTRVFISNSDRPASAVRRFLREEGAHDAALGVLSSAGAYAYRGRTLRGAEHHFVLAVLAYVDAMCEENHHLRAVVDA
jgi:hypothetical protein